mmetsp:Transcript_11688/g.29529  ORF Transcript_11688/g.29529 Transcript_11688/m.29529 type:complete len:296 (+) Transcript_11688:179-1066(+)|eukprot:CAMPEP_0177633236 /NCGR_PEP_ID=MMETSP0447-20121125/2729_1 /TAXON_ID=0 /ORGANISM="Stygamoeba regulata, Strain BSH-02190019" /LENGTH=295 /DNA_ID=CAMNT_0019134881 /DNA_START=93 /DNA_END=980 /DNA_ORIENTATION=+
MTLGPFSKVCKNADDLLSKVFPSVGSDGAAQESQTLKVEVKSANGLKNVVEASRKNQGAITASVEPSLTCDKCHGSFSAKVKSDSSVDVTITGNNVAKVDGLTVEVKAGLGAGVSVTPKVEFANDTVNTSVELAYPLGAEQKDGPKVDASLLFAYENFRIGGAATIKIADVNAAQAQFGAAYVQQDLLAGASVCWNGESKKYKVNAVFHHQLADLAADLVVKGSWEPSVGTNVTIGVQHKINESTSTKAKVNQAGAVGLALSTKVNSNVSLDLGSQFALGDLNDQKIALGVTLSN